MNVFREDNVLSKADCGEDAGAWCTDVDVGWAESDHDFDMSEGILKGIDCEIDVKLLHDPLVGFASKRN